MSAPLDGPPYKSKLVDALGILSGDWTRWIQLFWARVGSAVQTSFAIKKTAQSASISTTTAFTVVTGAVYRVSFYQRVTTIPTTSFSLTMTIGWRDGGVTKSQAFTALTGAPGALATAYQNGEVSLLRADSGTAITYAVLYASVGATAAVYAVDLSGELVS